MQKFDGFFQDRYIQLDDFVAVCSIQITVRLHGRD